MVVCAWSGGVGAGVRWECGEWSEAAESPTALVYRLERFEATEIHHPARPESRIRRTRLTRWSGVPASRLGHLIHCNCTTRNSQTPTSDSELSPSATHNPPQHNTPSSLPALVRSLGPSTRAPQAFVPGTLRRLDSMSRGQSTREERVRTPSSTNQRTSYCITNALSARPRYAAGCWVRCVASAILGLVCVY